MSHHIDLLLRISCQKKVNVTPVQYKSQIYILDHPEINIGPLVIALQIIAHARIHCLELHKYVT